MNSDTTFELVGGINMKKGEIIGLQLLDTFLSPKVYRINIAPNYWKGGPILKTIKYDHIPSINYYKEALLDVKKLDLKIYGKKIGYIIGAGDKVPEALEQMGYDVTLLGDKELSRNNLQQFDAIITGVRAYNTNDWMNNYYDKLMKYVNDGGNLIVQYNTSNQPVSQAKMSPYQFRYFRHKNNR